MNSFPIRKDTSIFADVKLRYRQCDLFLFIEDEKMHQVYRKIISRLFNNKIKIGKIYSLKSKNNVLEKFDEWHKGSSELKKCIFIVDKDFDHFKDIRIPIHSNLIELEYYTIENYLVTKEGAMALIQSKLSNRDHGEYESMLNWDEWFENINISLKDLFISYVLAHKYGLYENCSRSPHIYLKKGGYEVLTEQVDLYLEKIKKLSIENDIDFEEEFKQINDYFNEGNNYKYEELIHGKYLSAAMYKYLSHLIGKKLDEDLANVILADNIKLNNLKFIEERIVAI
ncbi:DUF4435 domain-containing protein [Pseudobacillus badius]|uniref:DUF4435 domain-containing protein n=1 Tax=Bacillus badius TaxID=1455 RepID=UPI0024A51853|nr:DUF4435 domain-containing protein [Bacillus badius]GLY10351.1 hypothetical protein Bbad01_15670 [Bacillus badius]